MLSPNVKNRSAVSNTKRKISTHISTLKTPLAVLNDIPVSTWETSSLDAEELAGGDAHQTVEFHPEADLKSRKAPASTKRKKSRKMGKRAKSPNTL